MDFTFAEQLRSLRVRASMTQEALANALNVHEKTVGAWEQGKNLPKNREMVLRVAEELTLSHAETDCLLHAADFPEEYGLPKTSTSPSLLHQLRSPVSDFVGRTAEVEQLTQALRQATKRGTIAAITGIQGMGGIGKTELAYVVANQVQPAFPDAQIVLTLRGTSANPLTPEQALQTVLRTFMPDAKLPEDLPTLEAHYRSQLHNKRVFILADDARDAKQLQPLHPPAGCVLLITSRQRFAFPAMNIIDLEQLTPDEAIDLLCNICPRLTSDEAGALAQACGYLPLALRVCGSLLRTDPALTIANYLTRLADTHQRLDSLRDPDDPQSNVEASLALSYLLLGEDAQQVFRQLGVITADFTINLAQAVVEIPRSGDVEATLRQLLRRNLVMYDLIRTRWRLHDLVRDLAQQQLALQGEAESVHWRYARAAVQLAQVIQTQYLAGGDMALTALAQFDTERPHIDAARRWADIVAGTPEGDQLLVAAIVATRHIDTLRADVWRERIPQWERALAAAQRVGDRHGESHALNNLGIAYSQIGDARHSIPYFEQYLALAREVGDRRGEGIALGNLGNVYLDLGEARRAMIYFEQDLALAREMGERQGEGLTLTNLGLTYLDLGAPQHAIPHFEQALAIARETGDRYNEGITLSTLGIAYIDLGEVPRAIIYCETSLSILRAIDARRAEGYALSTLARAQAIQGDLAHATMVFMQAVALFREVDDRYGEATGQWSFGIALTQQGKREQALPLLRATVAYEQEIGHAKAVEHATLVARLEAGESLPSELHILVNQQALKDNQGAPTQKDAGP